MWSLAMIVRDAEATIGQVLDDASSFCDELVVVDTGSTDGTMAEALAHGADVCTFEWVDDFSAARNFAFDQCGGDWIVWLDADDRIPPESQEAFRRLKETIPLMPAVPRADCFTVPYRIAFDAGDNCTFSFPRERVLRRSMKPTWVGPVHECIHPLGVCEEWPDAWVEHRPLPSASTPERATRNLRILRKATEAGDDSSRTLFYFANELVDHRIWHEAFDVYARYVERKGTMTWERHYGLRRMALFAQRLGWDEGLVLGCLHEAIQLDPTRAEAWIEAGKVHYDAHRWVEALPYFTAAAHVPLSPPRHGFVSLPEYGYLAYDYLASCLWEADRSYDGVMRAIRATKEAIHRGSPDVDRLHKNLGFYRARNAEPAPPEESAGS